jgi:hypothetical protein
MHIFVHIEYTAACPIHEHYPDINRLFYICLSLFYDSAFFYEYLL